MSKGSPSPVERARSKASCKVYGVSEELPQAEPRPALDPTVTREDLRRRNTDWFVIHPDNRLKSAYEVFIAACVLYTAIMEPVKVTYVVDFALGWDIALDVLFVLDIFVQFVSGYYDSGGSRFPVLKFRFIATRYLHTWFAMDLIAALPFDKFAGGGDSVAVRIPGLLKVVRLFKLKRLLTKLQSTSFGPSAKVLTILSVWLLMAHWLGCGFFILGWYGCAWHTETWVTQYWTELAPTCRTGARPDFALITLSPNNVTVFGAHVRAIAWSISTMSSMGYGRLPRPVSDDDNLYGIITQIIGACLAAAIFGNIAQLLNKDDAVATRYHDGLEQIREFSAIYKLRPEVKSRLFEYNELLFSVTRGFDLGAIAQKFPSAVQEDVFLSLHEQTLRQLPMLRIEGCDEVFFRAATKLLRPEVYIDGDAIFRYNEIGDRMFFISRGYVQVVNENHTITFTVLPPGSYFGEFAILETWRRKASAIAMTDLVVYSLSQADFQSVARRFDLSKDRMISIASKAKAQYVDQHQAAAKTKSEAAGAPSPAPCSDVGKPSPDKPPSAGAAGKGASPPQTSPLAKFRKAMRTKVVPALTGIRHMSGNTPNVKHLHFHHHRHFLQRTHSGNNLLKGVPGCHTRESGASPRDRISRNSTRVRQQYRPPTASPPIPGMPGTAAAVSPMIQDEGRGKQGKSVKMGKPPAVAEAAPATSATKDELGTKGMSEESAMFWAGAEDAFEAAAPAEDEPIRSGARTGPRAGLRRQSSLNKLLGRVRRNS